MKFSEKMGLTIMLKVTKRLGSSSLQKAHFWENHRVSQIDPPTFLELGS